MSIGGAKRDPVNFTEVQKFVGLFEGRVVAVNPTAEEFAKLTNQPDDWEPKEDSKQFDYLGESKDGNRYLRVDVWLEDTKKRKETVVENDEEVEREVNKKFKVTFFLEDKERENKDATRLQYINSVGICSWAEDPNDLPEWFVKDREHRVAFNGEEQIYNFMRKWLSQLDYRNTETILQLEWKKLMKGNVKELRDQINGEWSDNLVCLATVEAKERDGSVVEYQKVYNNDFLYPYTMKFFRTVDYSNPEMLEKLRSKKPRDLKPHEKFVLGVTDPEYGCKDYYILKDLTEYDAAMNFAASEKTISEEHPDY